MSALARHLFSQNRGYCAGDDAGQIGPKRDEIVLNRRHFLAQLAQFGAHIKQQGFVLAQLRQGLEPVREAQQAPLFNRLCREVRQISEIRRGLLVFFLF